MLYRSLGHYTETGAWVSPLSFDEAQHMSKPMLDTFFKLDDLLSRMEIQHIKKTGKLREKR